MAWWILHNSVSAGVLAAAVAGLGRLVRLSPAVRHALWLIVLVKLVAPPVALWPWPVPDRVDRFFQENVRIVRERHDTDRIPRTASENPPVARDAQPRDLRR